MAGTMRLAASHSYPTPFAWGQCGQKHVDCPKHVAFGAGPHCDVMAACMSTVGMPYLAMIATAATCTVMEWSVVIEW